MVPGVPVMSVVVLAVVMAAAAVGRVDLSWRGYDATNRTQWVQEPPRSRR